ncbi:MAG TPA: hypothetical protein PLO62_07385 [Candidatus Hydrogenedentes bacterium]|nr:hypothetical protein [Candidatus Hydrogenedentota bacterium]HOS03767.1 hypothetical protein [Candidatus Hydrogenedentota bacterium]
MYHVRVAIVVVGLGFVVAFAAATPAHAALDDATKHYLKQAFQTLSTTQDQAAADYVLQVLHQAPLSDGEWLAFSQTGIGAARFTPALIQFWDYAMRSAGDATPRMALFSALSAAHAAGKTLGRFRGPASVLSPDAAMPPDPEDHAPDGGAAALDWLQRVSPYVQQGSRDAVVAAFKTALGGRAPAAAIGGAQRTEESQTAWFGMQMCLSIAPYIANSPAARSETKFLGLPEEAARFWETYGVFVFDNGGSFAPEHLNSLASLLAAIPSSLHAIAALISTQAFGQDLTALRLGSPGQLVAITPLPMTQRTDPSEFTPHSPQPFAPAFTAFAAQQIVRAVQTEQFRKRPELQARRDIILRHARDASERYLRRNVAPQVYLAQPDELLPSVAHLWFVNTRWLFETALDLFSIEQTDAMDQFLLLGDLLSGGGASAPFYATDLSGKTTRFDAPIGRTRVTSLNMPPQTSTGVASAVPVDMQLVTALVVDGTSYVFGLNDAGGVITMTKTEGQGR